MISPLHTSRSTRSFVALAVVALFAGGTSAVLAAASPAGAVAAPPIAAGTRSATAPVAPSSWDPRFGLQGTGGPVMAEAYAGADAYIGGSFTTVAGMPTGSFSNIAHWTGQGFVPMGAGVDGEVDAVAVVGGKVYVGGRFNNAGGVPARHLAMWNGSTWSAVGAGVSTDPSLSVSEDVEALSTDGTHLFVGGQFDHAGTVAAQSVASYDPSTGAFSALGAGVRSCAACGTTWPGHVRSLLSSGGRLWVGGSFEEAGATLTSGIASWGGTAWTTYGAGVVSSSGSATVAALAMDPATGAVYVGGVFDAAGPIAVKGAARLTGATWASIGDFTDTAGASGTQSAVRALRVIGGLLYAGGQFDRAGGVTATHLAVRQGGTWSQVSSGVDNPVWALTEAPGAILAVGGSFDRSGPVALGNLGTWDGTTWGSYGQGVQYAGNGTAGTVNALSPTSTGTYAAGYFDQAGSARASSVARWDATGWHALGAGITLGGAPGVVKAMAQIGTDLYVAGRFDTAGTQAATNIARWDGAAWHPVGGGLSGGDGNALAVLGGQLYVGGGFDGAGNVSAHSLAVWNPGAGTWHPLGSNPVYDGLAGGGVYALAVYQTELLIGGSFIALETGNSALPTQNLVAYDTRNTFTYPQAGYSLFGGVNGQVNALALMSSGDLYVGGAFDHADTGPNPTSIAAANIAVWHGGTDGSWEPLGSGTSDRVEALAAAGATVYVGGTFASAGGVTSPGVAMYDGAARTWQAMGAGFSPDTHMSQPSVAAMVASETAGLYVGGLFVRSGGTAAGSVSLWSGPPQAPAAPVAAAMDHGVTLTWTAPASNGGGGISGYVVTPFVGTTAQSPVTFSTPATTHDLTGLVNGTTYTFKVAALNALGAGPVSPPSNAVTPRAGTSFHPLAPTRILDSRGPVGGWNARLNAGSPRALTITGGPVAVPATADAVVLNLTATGGSDNSFVTAYPAGAPVPNSSNVNFAAGQTIPNLVTVKVGSAGQVSFANAVGSVDLIADIVGYFDAAPADRYNALSPARILDSRGPNGAWNAPLVAGAPRTLTVTGRGGVPTTADAVIMNVTVTAPTANSFLTVFPAGATVPNASNLNFAAGQTVPNLVTVKVGTSGQVTFADAVGSTDVIADVVGYFDAGSGDLFHALAPARILDSRGPNGGWGSPLVAGTPRSLAVATRGGVPSPATAVIGNTTVTGSTDNSFVTVYPSGTPLPNASNLNFAAGQTIPNLVAVKLGADGHINLATAVGATDVIFDVVGFFAAA